MPSWKARLADLERDLLSKPMRISAYHDLPFAIFLYDPQDEFAFREELRRLEARLRNGGKEMVRISLASLLWQGIDETRGMDYIIEAESRFGYRKAEDTVSTLISLDRFRPLPDMLAERLQGLDPQRHVVFLLRAGALAPSVYRMSKLLDQMHGRTMIPLILCYPGKRTGEGELCFMGIEGRWGVSGYNYRVRIYGD